MLQIANIGPADLTVVFIVALLVFGPKKLPEVGRQVGLALREVRKLSNEFLGSVTGVQNDVHEAARSLNPFAAVETKPVQTKATTSETASVNDQPARRRGLTLSTLPVDAEAPGEETK